MITFIVKAPWSDGNLRERMEAEGLPFSMVATDPTGKFYAYRASPELLKAMIASGCPAEVVSDKNEWEHVHDKGINTKKHLK